MEEEDTPKSSYIAITTVVTVTTSKRKSEQGTKKKAPTATQSITGKTDANNKNYHAEWSILNLKKAT